jgi:dienelactone hydrolase
MNRRMAFAVLSLVLAGPTSSHAQVQTIQSGEYSDFRQLFARETPARSVSFAATLAFPDKGRDRYPAVVVVHTLAGYQEANEGWHAERFREAGFATVTYNSVAAARLREGAVASVWPSAIAEAYGVLKTLAGHPRIDADRIAIVGFSFGGEVAHLSAFDSVRAVLATGPARFAAHVAYYPAGIFGVAAQREAYTGAPVLMLLGDKDDNLPIEKVRGYLAYAETAGAAAPLQTSIYRGAYHAWTVSTLGAPRFYPQYPSMRKCPYLLLGAWPPAMLASGQATTVVRGEMEACGKAGQGYTMAYDEAARAAALRDTLAFLQKLQR